MTRFRFITPEDLLITHNIGLQTSHEAMCSHGQPALLLALFGTYRTSPDYPRQVHALVPRCALAELVGALQARILRDEGEGALQQFREEVTDSTEESARYLEQLQLQRRDCCEAGFTTHGAEHTCGRTTPGDDAP